MFTKTITNFLIIIAVAYIAVLLNYSPEVRKGIMPKIEIYTKSYCPYCVKAKDLLKRKGIEFEEISVEHDPTLAEFMVNRAGGRRTVPQIFINDKHIGGCDDLHAFDAEGKLDLLIE
jgi:glutaredoxin 3